MTRPHLPIAAAALAFCLSACATSVVEDAPQSVAIEFSPAAISPDVARVRAGGEVSWVNKATGRNGFIVFPLSIESDFTCHPLAPAFHEIGAGWRSVPITAEEGFTLPCPLKPGKYPYRLHLYDSKRDPKEVGEGEPLGDMRGHVVVE